MENNKEGKNEKKIELPLESTTSYSGIFSEDEIKNIVKAFISAYLRGDIKIDFKNAKELMDEAQMSHQKLSFQDALQQEIAIKKPVLEQIAICAGTRKATPEERMKAVSNLFYLIVGIRSSDRLIGNFMLFNPEKRLDKLEEDLSETNRLVQEMIFYLRSKDAKLPADDR